MMAVDIYPLSVSFAVGILIGGFYFGGLWWTLRRLPFVREPVLWVVGSFLVRSALSLLGFYIAAGGKWKGMLASLFGFVLVRVFGTMKVKTVGNRGSGTGNHVQ